MRSSIERNKFILIFPEPPMMMDLENLSYAQSLRAIGLSLEGIKVSALELETDGEDYLLRVTPNEPSAKNVGFASNLLARLAQLMRGPAQAQSEPSHNGIPGQQRYTRSDIMQLHAAQAHHGQKALMMPDPYKLSQILRVIGDYLDQKEARSFIISMSTHSLTVSYESVAGYQGREVFNVENLYDRAVRMYLQRSNRRE